ncbi:MAG: hypothetical protein ACREMS_09200 [Gemmatimonadaceae bacterium]
MTTRKFPRNRLGDVEKPHPVVADGAGECSPVEPLTVRLGDLWSDFLRTADETILDDMKGILQWD